MDDQNQPTKNAESEDASQVEASPAESESAHVETEELSGPDYRAHVRQKPRPLPAVRLYDRGQQVYLKRARGLQGPFFIRNVNSDGTYQLENESGKLFQDGAKERDLQPL
ncbi:hypothetical protein MMC13_001328 [Lambiella insularis]|nr:hypothetical protein [Lambiella insularis]